jgi:leucyl-tRNA---protein transferase
MTLPNDLPLQRLQFYLTTPYPCGYLPGRQAQSLIAAPQRLIDTAVYSELVRMGFRRSGLYSYRPHCENCQACVPVRLRVDDLTSDRSQRRAWKHHQHLLTKVLPLDFSEDHFQLYARYQKVRHAGGGMDKDDANQYRSFLTQSQIDTVLVEFREDDMLRMVSIVDRLKDGLSAVYAFYDTTVDGASFGTYNVLWLADWCRRLGQPYLYLGYWIESSPKMAYKTKFRPLEMFQDGLWRPMENL